MKPTVPPAEDKPTPKWPVALLRCIHERDEARGHLTRIVAAAVLVLADTSIEPTLETVGMDPNLGELAYCVALFECES